MLSSAATQRSASASDWPRVGDIRSEAISAAASASRVAATSATATGVECSHGRPRLNLTTTNHQPARTRQGAISTTIGTRTACRR
jgi:hypothetical protein